MELFILLFKFYKCETPLLEPARASVRPLSVMGSSLFQCFLQCCSSRYKVLNLGTKTIYHVDYK